ncbi:MAG: hemerythrin domain-containing protein [Hamadaea sp.]|uniref:hemerythrin domain-containing protein n=1 Tax=Hamadaea sp. TaxID=2024425 RepID=UPI00181B115B|nr:hemerythrin domain-containing protein [Hamadaea sp.]NUR72732.1 hemerythrin domain-containing protein [Hamadaea sp.]NUT18434.1 hemerythrin domain-containing protein [Hamadaea sp.]
MADHTRLLALSHQLADLHNRLRDQLADLDAPADLPTHRLAFCEALTHHHTSEETGAFTQLEAESPELRPILDELRRDHEQIVTALQQLADNPTKLQRDTLAALLETHFTYEERKLAAALNRLDPTLGPTLLGT